VTSNRTTLVTGGAGFIGSHLVDTLLATGERVVVIDDFSTGAVANLAEAQRFAPDQLTVLEGKVSDVLPTLDPASFRCCYHLAAAVGVRLVLEAPIATIETNVNETASILAFVKQAKVPTLIASTSEVYGKGIATPFSEDDDVVFGPTSSPRWAYAHSKAIDEHLALAYNNEGLAPTLVVRFFNTVGPRQTGEYGMVLPRFVDAALAGRPIEVHGDGLQSRCFCDVRDIVPALPTLLGNPIHFGRVFNLGSASPISIIDLATFVKERLSSSSEIVLVPYAEGLRGGLDDLRAREPDLSRIESAINFKSSIDLGTTVDDLAGYRATGGVGT
jgi:UDP-glucose 4-epimerase